MNAQRARSILFLFFGGVGCVTTCITPMEQLCHGRDGGRQSLRTRAHVIDLNGSGIHENRLQKKNVSIDFLLFSFSAVVRMVCAVWSPVCVCASVHLRCVGEDRLAFVFLAHYYYASDILPQISCLLSYLAESKPDARNPRNETKLFSFGCRLHAIASSTNASHSCVCQYVPNDGERWSVYSSLPCSDSILLCLSPSSVRAHVRVFEFSFSFRGFVFSKKGGSASYVRKNVYTNKVHHITSQ